MILALHEKPIASGEGPGERMVQSYSEIVRKMESPCIAVEFFSSIISKENTSSSFIGWS